MSATKKAGWVKWILVLTFVTSGIGYAGWYLKRPLANQLECETVPISRGELSQVVTASGQVKPVVQVEVGSQISGIIQKLFADFNSTVKAGELLAEIEPGTYEANSMQAEGNLANAKAALELAQLQTRRNEGLFKNELISQAELESTLASLHQAEATVKINEGTLKKAQVDLARCKISAPIDGVVISRDVNVGQTVAASLSAPKLFVIANDLTKMQIEAKVPEADIGRIQVDQEVKFSVDAFPDEKFHGRVSQVRNAPVVDLTVVMYDTIIDVTNPNQKLKPGMTANVSIIVAHRADVLKIPNAALRFRPPKTVQVVKADPPEADAEKMDGPDASAKSEKKSDDETKVGSSKSRKDKKEKKKSEHTAYVLKDGRLQAVKLQLGITDGRNTELFKGLNAGDTVVVNMAEPTTPTSLTARILAVLKGKK
ncbi:MAG TPA: efflux RND transporter periplasmic adaptor subunit [Verrucomicrobiae bacterium]|nr:efflux RND transporter periplasmic adaptor subunit [Verrucomicrobiae bacterium]